MSTTEANCFFLVFKLKQFSFLFRDFFFFLLTRECFVPPAAPAGQCAFLPARVAVVPAVQQSHRGSG